MGIENIATAAMTLNIKLIFGVAIAIPLGMAIAIKEIIKSISFTFLTDNFKIDSGFLNLCEIREIKSISPFLPIEDSLCLMHCN